MRILVVEDHREVRQFLEAVLREAGYTVNAVASRAEAERKIRDGGYAGILLDWMLPDGSGADLCREMREAGDPTPVLMLTARGDVEDRVHGLDAGADDYLKKPFAAAELRARVRALLRRGPRLEDPVFREGSVEIRFAERRLLANGGEIPMTAREFDILEALARQRGRVVSRSTILVSVWGSEDEGAASLEVLVARIRRKLEAAGCAELIRTHRGLGYSIGIAP